MINGRLRFIVLLVLVSALSAGCVDAAREIAAAAMNEELCGDASAVQAGNGGFQYAGAASCKTERETYSWTNMAIYATVQWGGAVVKGSVEVTILDAVGREVHAFKITNVSAEGAQGRTEAGFPTVPPVLGGWTVEVEFDRFTGTMGLQLASSNGEWVEVEEEWELDDVRVGNERIGGDGIRGAIPQ